MRNLARVVGLSAAEKRSAEAVLGRRHRLTRSLANLHTVAVQAIVATCAVLVAAAALDAHVRHAGLLLGATLVVSCAYLLAWTAARRIARERAEDLIAAGDDCVVLWIVARERHRLASRKERESLADSLESLHRDALRWSEIVPQFRPPDGVQRLREVSPEVAALTAALRRDRVRVQGVALTARLLCDGYGSPLYGNELGPLREELNRIHYLLESTDEPMSDAPAERIAA